MFSEAVPGNTDNYLLGFTLNPGFGNGPASNIHSAANATPAQACQGCRIVSEASAQIHRQVLSLLAERVETDSDLMEAFRRRLVTVWTCISVLLSPLALWAMKLIGEWSSNAEVKNADCVLLL